MRTVFAVLLALILTAPTPLSAQEGAGDAPAADPGAEPDENFAPSHLAAAQRIIEVTRSGEQFDDILPSLVDQTRLRFVQATPSLAREIEEVVMEVGVEMAARRADLARVMQLIWARRFTEEELDTLYDFFTSDVGAKFADATPIISALTLGAARQWQEALSTQMVSATRAKLAEEGYLQ